MTTATAGTSPRATTHLSVTTMWREDEEGETDTPENTGSKVGTGRDDMQP